MEKEIKDALNFVIGAATTVKSETEKTDCWSRYRL